MALFRSLRHLPFTLLWSGQTLSRIGDFVYQIALAWWVLQKTGSAAVMGTVLIIAMSPMLLFLLVGGLAVDRFPRMRLMLWSDLLRGIVVAAVAWLAWQDALEVWHIYVASLVFGFVDAFFQPAYTALVPELVPVQDLTSANSLTSISTQIGRILGPALGAGLVALGGTPLAFALNALSFFISTLLLLPLWRQSSAPGQAAPAQGSILADLREGVRIVLGAPWLWLTITLAAFTNVSLAGPYNVAIPFLFGGDGKEDVNGLGLLYAIFAMGYVLGGVWFGRMHRIRRRGLVGYGGIAVAGLMMAVIGLHPPFWVMALAALVNGVALEAFSIIWTSSLQEMVPRAALGRVASIDALGSYGLLPVGFAVAGWTTEQWGAPLVCLAGGLLTVLVMALGLLHPTIRRLD
ncbi:MAG: MFS transporter [Anaerolineae bacterium]